MPFLTLLNWRWLAAAVLVAALLGTHFRAWQAGSASTQAKWDAQTAAQKVAQTAATLALVQAAQETERSLQASAEKLRKAKNAEINDVATKLADAVDSLRNRPSRAAVESGVPATAGVGDAGPGCRPAQLFAEDAALALELAADAEQLLAYARYCQAQYTKARDQLTKGATHD